MGNTKGREKQQVAKGLSGIETAAAGLPGFDPSSSNADTGTGEAGRSESFFISRDEMNLAEFPLTVLSTRSNPNIKTLEFSDIIYHKNGKPINRRWTITGADKFGLPTSTDDEVLLGLLKLTVQSGFQDRKITFTRYELMKSLRWSTEGRNYMRLQNALDRLSGVRIKATNAFYDNESKSHSTRNFGLIDAYEINDGREYASKPSFFIWSEVLFKSFQAGFIKKIDLDYYLSLKSAVSKRLYRYLDKHFWYRARVQINLFTLCHEKLGVSRNYKYPSLLKQQLDVAIEELKERGFLSEAGYIGKGKTTEAYFISSKGARKSVPLKVYEGGKKNADSTPASKGQLQLSREDVSLQAELGMQLQDLGLSRKQSLSLLEEKDAGELERVGKVVSYLKQRVFAQKDGSTARNPIGLLYRAVEKPYEFKLPGDSKEKASAPQNTPSERQSPKQEEAIHAEREQQMREEYYQFRSAELAKIANDVEPSLASQLDTEAREALKSVKRKISPQRFEESVKHRVDQKLLELFSVKDFSEWLLDRK